MLYNKLKNENGDMKSLFFFLISKEIQARLQRILQS